MACLEPRIELVNGALLVVTQHSKFSMLLQRTMELVRFQLL
jgi:hypothetical protein